MFIKNAYTYTFCHDIFHCYSNKNVYNFRYNRVLLPCQEKHQ